MRATLIPLAFFLGCAQPSLPYVCTEKHDELRLVKESGRFSMTEKVVTVCDKWEPEMAQRMVAK